MPQPMVRGAKVARAARVHGRLVPYAAPGRGGVGRRLRPVGGALLLAGGHLDHGPGPLDELEDLAALQ
jgi:hypothetical protein